MLTPDELKVLPDHIVAIYQNLEDEIIKDIARRLEKTGEFTSTAQWQLYMLQNMGEDLREVRKRIADINAILEQEVENLFNDAMERSNYYDNMIAKKAGKKTVDIAKNKGMQQFIKASALKTTGELKNLTKSLGFKDGKQFKPIAKFYQDTLSYAQFQIASGAFTPQQAIQIAVKKMVDSGIRTVDYESGITTRIDVAVRRATLTGINQTSGTITMMWLDEVGGEYVEVSAHSGARPDHATWQGKVYKVNGSDKDYPNLVDVTGYGSVTGLKGANCRHDFSPFFPGVSVRNYTDEDLANIDPPPFEYDGKTYTHYEATQKQRQIERAIRKTKQEMIAYDSAGQKEDFTWSAVKLQRQKELYRDFSKKAGLRLKEERQQLYGYGRSISQKGVWADRKAKTWENALEKGISTKKNYGEGGVVDIKYITSRAYKNKFKNLTDNEVVNNEIHKQAVAMLKHRSGTNKENLCVIDKDTGKVVALTTNSDTNFEVKYTKKLNKLVKENPYQFITIHNHPNNVPPTGSDLVSSGSNKYSLGVLVCHDGSVYVYKAGEIPFGADVFDMKVDRYIKEGYNRNEAGINALETFVKSHGIFWKEV